MQEQLVGTHKSFNDAGACQADGKEPASPTPLKSLQSAHHQDEMVVCVFSELPGNL